MIATGIPTRLLRGTLFASGLALGGAGARAQLGPARFGGSGCPQSSARAETRRLSNGGLEILFFFDRFRTNQVGLARQTCSAAVPLELAPGTRLEITGGELRGSVLLPRFATARFRAEVFLPGSSGPVVSRTVGPNDFDRSQRFNWSLGNLLLRTACGSGTNLRANVSLTVQNPSGRVARGSLSEYDLGRGSQGAGLVLRGRITRCP